MFDGAEFSENISEIFEKHSKLYQLVCISISEWYVCAECWYFVGIVGSPHKETWYHINFKGQCVQFIY